jgi:hypothetical protein
LGGRPALNLGADVVTPGLSGGGESLGLPEFDGVNSVTSAIFQGLFCALF